MSYYLDFPGTFHPCAWCGMTFYKPTTAKWLYKIHDKTGVHYFCCWTCLHKWQAAQERRPKR